MSGIIAITSQNNCVQTMVEGVKAQEYKGYDSVGIAWQTKGKMASYRTSGGFEKLLSQIDLQSHSSTLALGHLRWATHGSPEARNAHPQTDPKNQIYVIHNGIIDNYKELKNELLEQGAIFSSDTDTEVAAHLIANAYTGDLLKAVESVLPRLSGVYSLAIASVDCPDTIIGVHMGSSLIVGKNDETSILTSDIASLRPHTQNAYYLSPGQLVIMTPGRISFRENNAAVTLTAAPIDQTEEDTSKAGYPHYMLKEIYEQPSALKRLIGSFVSFSDAGIPHIATSEKDIPEKRLSEIKRIVLLAHGTAYHAALIGRTLIERLSGIPSTAEHAADFRYREPILEEGTLYITITQSGETVDTLAALRMVKEKGFPVLAMVNVATSTIAREADFVFPLLAGPEIGIASTKVFTSMIAGLQIFALRLGIAKRYSSQERIREQAENLLKVCGRVHETLLKADEIKKIAEIYKDSEHFMFLGRNLGCPLALEGALKLKETSYIHAEGMSAAEFKHGPMALVDEKMPLLFIAYKNSVYDKTVSNIHEVKARKGRVIAIISQDDTELEEQVDNVIRIHDDCGAMNTITCAVPLQLFAYYAALARGSNVDSPKNLSKSVTVE